MKRIDPGALRSHRAELHLPPPHAAVQDPRPLRSRPRGQRLHTLPGACDGQSRKRGLFATSASASSMPYAEFECPARPSKLRATQKARASTMVDARAVFRPKSQFVEYPIYAASSPGSSFLLSSICFSSSARFLALISSRFCFLTSNCFSAPSSSMKAFSAPSPFWKPVRTMRR